MRIENGVGYSDYPFFALFILTSFHSQMLYLVILGVLLHLGNVSSQSVTCKLQDSLLKYNSTIGLLHSCIIEDSIENDNTFIATFDADRPVQGFSIESKPVSYFPKNIGTMLNNLIVMRVEECAIQSLKKETFSNLDSLEILRLKGNAISEIEGNALHGLIMLRELDLTRNQIERLNDDTFYGLDNLDKIFLGRNRLSIISDNLFMKSMHVNTISLEHNEIISFNATAFTELRALRHLNLDHNQCISKNFTNNDIHRSQTFAEESKKCHGKNGGSAVIPTVLMLGALVASAHLMMN